MLHFIINVLLLIQILDNLGFTIKVEAREEIVNYHKHDHVYLKVFT